MVRKVQYHYFSMGRSEKATYSQTWLQPHIIHTIGNTEEPYINNFYEMIRALDL
ncbi:MAG: hypothetical protein H5T39_00640 [Methanobacteriales archaeon]|nr:hypothetical protein [Methanobacteriales archaeon]